MKNRLLKYLLVLIVFFPATTHALTIKEFTELQKEQQLFYLMGVLDKEIINASYGPERSECVQKWGIKGAYDFLINWYNQDPTDTNKINLNVALLVGLQVSKVCNFDRRYPETSKPPKNR